MLKRVFSNRAPSFDVSKVKIAEIQVIGERRPLDKAKLHVIADLMSKIGLRTPLTVHKRNDGKIVLDTGLHRLEAAKSLGWSEIDCIVMERGKVQRQLWTVAENLHRIGLTKLQRAEAIAKWAQLVNELDDKDVQVAQPGGKQPKDKGISKVAKQLGVTRETVRRSTEIARLSPSAKVAIEATGLDNNDDAMLKAAKEQPKAQVARVAELAAKSKAAPKGKKKSLLVSEKKKFSNNS